mgnify:CR=1 FL=1
MEPWMREKLEKLREEQKPTWERPALRLPVLTPPPPSKEKEREPASERGVVVIDMCV